MLRIRPTHFILCLSTLTLCGLSTGYATDASPLKSEIDKVSYAIGLKYGQSLKRDLNELDVNLMAQGLKDGFDGKTPRMTDVETAQALTAFQQKKRAEIEKARAETAEANKAKGEAFLSKNAKQADIKVTDSGLQYKVLTAGKGQSPGPNDTVTVHYEGSLIDGSVFDSSRQRGKPIQFSVNGVIPGWTEALQLMKPGAHWQIFIPSDLAYGESGASSAIGPNETLIFDVELLEISQKEAGTPNPHMNMGQGRSPH